MKILLTILFMLFVPLVGAEDFTQDANCVGAWTFSEGTGTTVTDDSQNSNTINFKGTGEPAWSSDVPTGFSNYSADLDGGDDYMSATCAAMGATGTLLMWSQSDLSSDSSGDDWYFFDTSDEVGRYLLYHNDVDDHSYFAGGTEVVDFDASFLYDAAEWFNVAVRWDTADDEYSILKNGFEAGSDTTAAASSTPTTIYFGSRFSLANFFNGHHTEIGRFDIELTDEQINQVMRQGLEGDYSHYSNPLYIQTASQLHCDTIRLTEPIDGYQYWMSHTPFPPTADEHPSISRSNDCAVWTATGISNPVVDTTYVAEPDPDILYIPEYGKWFMAFSVEDDAEPYNNHICFAYSTDGVTWTEYDGAVINSNTNPIILSGKDDGGVAWEVITGTGESRLQYPALIYEAGTFTLFYGETTGNAADADDGGHGNNTSPMGSVTFTWNNVTDDIENFARNGNNPFFAPAKTDEYWYGAGHFDVTFDDVGTYHLYCLRREDSGTELGDMWHYTSTDKETWIDGEIVITKGAAGTWNAYEIYRGGPIHNGKGRQVMMGGQARIIYSAFASSTLARIGIYDVTNFSTSIPLKPQAVIIH